MAFTTAALLWWSQWGHGTRLRVVLWAAVLLPLAQWPLRASGPPETYRMLVDGFGFHRLHLFVAGVAIWMWVNNRLTSWHFGSLLSTCVAAHLLHNITFDPEGWTEDWAAASESAAASCSSVWPPVFPTDGWVPSALHGPLQWLAGISYGVYLAHQTMGYLLIRNLHDAGFGPFTQTIAAITIALFFGRLLNQFIERPVYQWLINLYHHATAEPGALATQQVRNSHK